MENGSVRLIRTAPKNKISLPVLLVILFLLNSLLFHSNNRIGYDQVNDSEKHPLDHIVAIQHYIHS